MRFLQILEGERRLVEATFARISPDPRHFGVYRLMTRDIENRDFGAWDMAYREVNNPADVEDLAQAELMTALLPEGEIRDRIRFFSALIVRLFNARPRAQR